MNKPNPVAKVLRTPRFKPLVIKAKKKEYVRKEKHKQDLTRSDA